MEGLTYELLMAVVRDHYVDKEPEDGAGSCHAFWCQHWIYLSKGFSLGLTLMSWGVTRMRWCHLWELPRFMLGVEACKCVPGKCQ
jgi:hypothetical protein